MTQLERRNLAKKLHIKHEKTNPDFWLNFRAGANRTTNQKIWLMLRTF